MNEKQTAEIEALMKRHDARTGKRADDQRPDEEFAAVFSRLRREVIKPTMEQVAEKLETGGHHAGPMRRFRLNEVTPRDGHAGDRRGVEKIVLTPRWDFHTILP